MKLFCVSWIFSMAASFYASPLIGATTTLACFAHEIPHEIADYSILIRSGFTKTQAMQSQFLTAIGAFVGVLFLLKSSRDDHYLNDRLGKFLYLIYVSQGWRHPHWISTFIGIAVHTATSTGVGKQSADLAAGVRQDAPGLLGTTVQFSDLASGVSVVRRIGCSSRCVF